MDVEVCSSLYIRLVRLSVKAFSFFSLLKEYHYLIFSVQFTVANPDRYLWAKSFCCDLENDIRTCFFREKKENSKNVDYTDQMHQAERLI